MMGLSPYIAFRGDCREALDFYKKALGAEVLYSESYGNSPMSQPGIEDKILHATIKVGDTHIMMCDDLRPEASSIGGNISLAVGLNDTGNAASIFEKLADGGTVTMPLEKTFWAESFGMLTDKFGVSWMINCDKPHEEGKPGNFIARQLRAPTKHRRFVLALVAGAIRRGILLCRLAEGECRPLFGCRRIGQDFPNE